MNNLKSFCESLFKADMFLVWALSAIGLLPFILLVAYSHPSADDWYMAAATQQVGFIQANVDCYFKMGGRYVSNVLLFAHPMLVSFEFTKVYCLVIILGMVPAAVWAAVRWFPGAGTLWQTAFGIMLLTAFCAGMPSPTQAFYWLTGNTCYIVPVLLFLILAAVLGRESLGAEWRPSRARVAVCCVLAFLITGCSEVAMALVLLALVVLLLAFWWEHSRVNWPFVAMLVCVVVGIAIVMLAPGNAQRIKWYNNDVHHVPAKAVVMALELGVRQLIVWVLLGILLPVTLVLIAGWPEEPNMTRRRAWSMIFWAAVLILGTVFGGFFLGTWSMGDYLPLRSTNQLYFFFLLGWFVLAGGVASLLRARGWRLPRLGPVLAGAAFVIFVGIVAVGASHPIWGGACNVKNAWKDLLGGGAAAFDKECYARYDLIRSSQAADLTVPRLKSRPPTIFFSDLSDDPANWRNLGMSAFFHKRRLLLEPQ